MSKKVDVIVANPAGNTTIMVLSPTPMSEYQETANRLLEIDFCRDYGVKFTGMEDSVLGEQVEYVLPDSESEEYPAMNMCGMEFCGNASRAFAYYRAACYGDGSETVDDRREVTVKVSGCSYPLSAVADIKNHSAEIQMPTPVRVIELTPQELGLENGSGKSFKLIDLDGISHLVLPGVEASPELFDRLKNYLYENIDSDMEAMGIMFLNEETFEMTPVVYVKGVDTTYFEGSCASGTVAATCAIALEKADGEYNFSFKQPAGVLHTVVNRENGAIRDVRLNGLLELSDIITVEI